jgi:hypothetical protein
VNPLLKLYLYFYSLIFNISVWHVLVFPSRKLLHLTNPSLLNGILQIHFLKWKEANELYLNSAIEQTVKYNLLLDQAIDT